ncbi:hypothetical protein RCL_jg13586.t1 [Rhizophagus clarus]|uniref:Uncharacterized protein n=1 Tax=Rhizophagus clarus TaxID=94130 RepID=A0A8H3LRF3_9GLOM|nr:hypothetical protein RCL_jg13586.t1 [Rhizophagus clarus]
MAVIRSRSDFDQQSVTNDSEDNLTNESGTNSRGSSTNSSSISSGSSGSSGSSQRFANIISVIRQQFTNIVELILCVWKIIH